ncbi:MAG: ROK family protein, partial [Methanococcaceae archaeon]
KLYRGSKFFAGEIGHIQLDKKGPKCGCGHKGCFEAIASRTAIVRDIKKDLKDKKKIKTGVSLPVNKPIKSKGLAAAIKKKDPIVIKRVSDACDTIGQTLANISNILNLDMIVLGGGVIEALDKFMLPKIKTSFAKTVLTDAAKGLKIIATKLGDDAALYGGISLAEEMESIKN